MSGAHRHTALVGLALPLLAACTFDVPPGSLSSPELPDTTVDIATPPDGADDVPSLDVDVGAPVACTGDGDCAHVQGCCYTGACVSGTCIARALVDCCSVAGPCAVSSPLHAATCADTCVAGGCERTLRLPEEDCETTTLWSLDLDDPLSQATVSDLTPDDRVTWHPTTARGLNGGPSVHAGDVVCPTYYSGPLNAACEPVDPSADADAVRLNLDTTSVTLPADRPAVAELWLWLDLEPSSGRPASAVYDGVEIGIVDEGGAIWPRWSSRQTPPPPRTWTPVVVDLTELAGHTVHLRVAFDTVDGRDNHHEGVYLGALRVITPCAADRACPTATACAVGTPTMISPSADALCVTHAPSPGQACTACDDAESCPVDDACDVASCDAGRCSVTRTLTAECCDPAHAFPAPASFEADLGATWAIEGEDAGLWHRSNRRARSGVASLRFGVPGTAETAPPGESASGEVWTPTLTVPPDAPRWSFWVWLSTEFDAAPDASNPAGLDLLEALVSVDTGTDVPLPPAVVWDSRAIGGTSAGEWLPATVDLSAFAGRAIRLGWRFTTGDAEANDREGAFIDDAAAYRQCPREGEPGGGEL